MNSTAVRVDYFTAIERQSAVVAKLLRKRDAAEHAHRQAEQKLEALKAESRRASDADLAASGQEVR